jgi:hypothetical protein
VRAAFYLSAGLVIVAGLLAAFTLGGQPAGQETPEELVAEA